MSEVEPGTIQDLLAELVACAGVFDVSTDYEADKVSLEKATQAVLDHVQTIRDERDRLREALEKIVAGIDHYGADHILREQYLADNEWWSLKRGDHSFPLWIAWMALKQAALTPAGVERE